VRMDRTPHIRMNGLHAYTGSFMRLGKEIENMASMDDQLVGWRVYTDIDVRVWGMGYWGTDVNYC
jgi:hypothetical protein